MYHGLDSSENHMTCNSKVTIFIALVANVSFDLVTINGLFDDFLYRLWWHRMEAS